MLFDSFDMIRIINLAHRKDRRAEMESELAHVGLANDPRVSFFSALSFEDAGHFSSSGARGCFHSHLEILKEAVQKNQSVLILEDDVDFLPGAERYVMPKQWSIFYGGQYAVDPTNLQTSDIVGSHMMGFSADTALKVFDYLNTLSFSGIHPPIDGAYVWFRRAHPEVATLFAEPSLGNQRPSRTDIGDLKFFDRVAGLRSIASLARKIKRRIGSPVS